MGRGWVSNAGEMARNEGLKIVFVILELLLHDRLVDDIMETMDMIEIILREIEACGKTRYKIAQDTGVSEGQLHRLVSGGSLKAETAGTLLEYFGYEVRKKKGRGKK